MQLKTELIFVFIINAYGSSYQSWHDIRLFTDKEKQVYNMVVSIPRGTNAKMEIATEEPLNGLKRHVKNGVLPFVNNKYVWNYEVIPRTRKTINAWAKTPNA